jgi:hypothetical protein
VIHWSHGGSIAKLRSSNSVPKNALLVVYQLENLDMVEQRKRTVDLKAKITCRRMKNDCIRNIYGSPQRARQMIIYAIDNSEHNASYLFTVLTRGELGAEMQPSRWVASRPVVTVKR